MQFLFKYVYFQHYPMKVCYFFPVFIPVILVDTKPLYFNSYFLIQILPSYKKEERVEILLTSGLFERYQLKRRWNQWCIYLHNWNVALINLQAVYSSYNRRCADKLDHLTGSQINSDLRQAATFISLAWIPASCGLAFIVAVIILHHSPCEASKLDPSPDSSRFSRSAGLLQN